MNTEHRAVLETFLARLRGARERVLALDYDGTLAPFVARREDADLYPGIAPLLARIREQGTHIAFITGRPAPDLARRLPLTGIEIYGSHGHEYLGPDGALVQTPLEAPVRSALERLGARIQEAGDSRWLERKHATVAIHWRDADPRTRASLESLAASLSADLPAAIAVLPFDGGIEFRARGHDKGVALRSLLARHPGAVAAYLGDDHTDEDAFAALPRDDLGILVRPDFRATGARLWLRPPDELRAFLGLWARIDAGEAPAALAREIAR